MRDPDGELIARYDLSAFRTLFLAGERSGGDPPTLAWAQEKLRVPVIDHWWQTETGSAIVSNYVGLDGPGGKMLPIKAGVADESSAGLGRSCAQR